MHKICQFIGLFIATVLGASVELSTERRAFFRSFLVLIIFLVLGQTSVWAAQSGKEYQVKAAFLYNFMRFVDWPEERIPLEGKPMLIGIVGENPFGSVLKVIEGKSIKGRPLKVQYLPSLKGLEEDTEARLKRVDEFKQHHLLFFTATEKPFLPPVLSQLKKESVLTVSEFDGFLDMDGMINFITEDSKGRFEINLKAARNANLDVRAKLLRLAKEVKE